MQHVRGLDPRAGSARWIPATQTHFFPPLMEDGFDELSVGEEVRFSEEEGLEGPQATAVWPVSSHHPVERRPRKEGWK